MAAPLLTGLLKEVSRSFYLTMRVLPPAIRPQVSLAYLLARTTDTIADTDLVSVDKRLQALRELRERILGRSQAPLHFGELTNQQALPAEKVLLQRVEEALAVLATFDPGDQQRVREVLSTITSGQELDLIRFSHANEKRILALQTEHELDGYTYRVAGCVGEFWTKMCRAHLFPSIPVNEQFLLQNGVKFGKGLQMVNILRDLPRDLRQGRCYVPREQLENVGLKPEDLLAPEKFGKFQSVFLKNLDVAENHLRAGWEYTNALPRSETRLRLACAWPILIGMKTIRALRVANVLDASERVKVSKSDVWRIMIASAISHPFDKRWRSLIDG